MDVLDYSFRASLFSKELSVRLLADELEMRRGNDFWQLGFSDIRKIRLFAGPVGAGQDASFCYIIPYRGRALKLRSSSIKGLAKYEDRSAQFKPFVEALVPRVAGANSLVEFIAGPSMLTWWTYLVIVVLAVVILAIFGFALVVGAMPGTSVSSMIILLFFLPALWRLVRRGQPRRFDPAKLDDQLVTGKR